MTYFVSPANLQAMEQGLVIGKAEVVGATFNQAQYGGTGPTGWASFTDYQVQQGELQAAEGALNKVDAALYGPTGA